MSPSARALPRDAAKASAAKAYFSLIGSAPSAIARESAMEGIRRRFEHCNVGPLA
jgi:hypothetical protein